MVFAIHWHESARVYMCPPSWTSFPPPSPCHPSGSSQCTSPEHPVWCIKPGLAILMKAPFLSNDTGLSNGWPMSSEQGSAGNWPGFSYRFMGHRSWSRPPPHSSAVQVLASATSALRSPSASRCESVSCSVMSNSLRPHELWPINLLCPQDSPGKNTGVGCHVLLQGVFPTRGWSPGLLHRRQILHHLRHQGALFAASRCLLQELQPCPLWGWRPW